MITRFGTLALTTALVLANAACPASKDGTDTTVTDTRSDTGVNDTGTPDGTSPDGTSPDGTRPDGTSPDGTSPDGTSPDGTTPGDTTPGDTQSDTSVPPGSFGAACNADAECDAGHCVPTPEGFVCSKTFFEECPLDWTCAGVPGEGGDVTFLCLHKRALVGQPCRANAECNPGIASGANACVADGDNGSFCGLACASDGQCPAGFACTEVTGAGKQCTATGEHVCNPSGIKLGMTTDCRFTNEHGTCGGTRACATAGLTECGGLGAQPETCNGKDDDCNGEQDEGLPAKPCEIVVEAGRCVGVTACTGGEEVCVGQLPSDEKCNGIDDDCSGETDEGFTNTDGDALADCVDPDDDNDAALDPADCAPLDGTVFPGQTEACNGKDDDCDLLVDEQGATGCRPFMRDADADLAGAASNTRCLCAADPASGYTTDVGGDCNDFDPNVRPGVGEICNFVDDDCNGSTDEGVQSPCGDCSPVCHLQVGGRNDSEALDPSHAEPNTMVTNPDGSLSLASSNVSIPFIWIANSPEDTVSKLDTSTGKEVGRYTVCDDPSRTAVDLNGDAVVGCRGDGKVAKIAIVEADCLDKNQNGRIDTSRDINGDGVIGNVASGERVTNDECIMWTTSADPDCGARGERCARAAGVDKDNNVWIGFYGSKNIVQLDGETGQILRTFPVTFSPYGLAIAGDGVIWVASRDPHGLGKVDAATGQVGFYAMPSGRNAYGMAIDHTGKIWVATGEHGGASRLDPADASWTNFGPWDRGYTRGVAVRILTNADGAITGSQVFVAHHDWGDADCSDAGHRYITMVDAVTGNEVRAIDLGAERGPVGVAVASDGMLWTCNQCTSNATRVNPDTGVVLGNFPVGSNPYTYSDMTGYALRTITSRSGYYRETFRGWDVGLTRWTAIFVEASLPGNGESFLRIRYRVGDSAAGLASTPFSPSAGPFPPASLPLSIDAIGRYIEVEVTLGTDDPAAIPTLKGVSVLGDQL